MRNIELSVFTAFSFLGFVAALLSLPWHLNPLSSSTLALTLWLSMMCLLLSIDSIVLDASVWCDISTKVMIGAYAGVPAALLCSFRCLHALLKPQDSTVAPKRHHTSFVDICCLLGIPIFFMCFHIAFQSSRYVVFEDAGCFPSVYPSQLSYILLFIWPIVSGTFSTVYAGLAFRLVHNNERQLSELLSSTSDIRSGRFVSMFAFSMTALASSISTGILVLYATLGRVDLQPLNSMKHDWIHVDVTSASKWRSDPRLYILVEIRWLLPVLALVSFAMFALTQDTPSQYSWTYKMIRRLIALLRCDGCHREREFELSRFVSEGSLPVYHNRRSFDSRDTNNDVGLNASTYSLNASIAATRGSIVNSPLSHTLVWTTYRAPSVSESNPPRRLSSISDSLPSTSSIITNESSCTTTSSGQDTFPQSTSSISLPESSSSAYTTCEEGSVSH